MKRFRIICAFLLPLLAAAFQADVSGRWTGTIAVTDVTSGTVITTPVEIQFTQHEFAISGKIGRARDVDAVPIAKGRIEGNKLYFEASSEETTSPCRFTLTIAGDSMEGDMTAAVENEAIAGKVRVTRLKN